MGHLASPLDPSHLPVGGEGGNSINEFPPFNYIGSTILEIEERLSQHHQKPTNDDMQLALQGPNITIKLLAAISFHDPSALLALEDDYIAQYLETITNVKLLNVKRPKVKIPVKITIVPQAPDVPQKRIVIHDNKDKRILSIDIRIKGIRHKGAWRYAERGFDSAMILAEAFRQLIITGYCKTYRNLLLGAQLSQPPHTPS